MRKTLGSILILALAVAAAAALLAGRAEAGSAPGPLLEAGSCDAAEDALASAKPCIIRCSDLTGCQRCCPAKGGWVCEPV